jgi:hypothetical protein
MSDLQQVKQQADTYLSRLKGDKSELVKAISITLFSGYLTAKFLGSFDSSLGYDIRGEFSGYLILLSFLSFLFINHKFTKSDGLKLLSFCHLILCLTNFLIIKSLSTLMLLKLITSFASIFLLLVIVREIKNRD